MSGFMHISEGMPKQGEEVEVKTVFSCEPHKVVYQGAVSNAHPEKGKYPGFGCYGLGCVTHWRSLK